MATVSLRHVRKSYGAVTVIDDLSLDIADQEFLVLLGPSGCGKTTTMRMIAGLEDVTAGDLLIDGKRVNDTPARQRDLAMVFQNYGLYPHMTRGGQHRLSAQGAGPVARRARCRGSRPRPKRSSSVPYLQRRPGELSGGQRQRVALARAIVRTPRLFLMDEPLSNLDAKLRTSMRAQIKHLQRDLATTTVYVTHDQVEAMTLADRIVIMDKGRIQQQGSPAEIYARPGQHLRGRLHRLAADEPAARARCAGGALPACRPAPCRALPVDGRARGTGAATRAPAPRARPARGTSRARSSRPNCSAMPRWSW